MLVGAQRSWSGRGTVEASAGDLITVNPGEVHDGAPIGTGRTWAMLYVSPAKLTAIARDIRETHGQGLEFTDPVIRNRRAAEHFAAAYAGFTSQADEAADERLIVLVAGLLHETPESQSLAGSALGRVRARINDDPVGHHPLRELAREAGASQYQTLRSFARLTGLTPHAYVVQRRLDVGRSMIRRGGSLADAAAAAGFADQSHFHRSFTQRYGLTPGEYAAAMR